MTEKDIEKLHIIECQKVGSTLFKNNVGSAKKVDPKTGKEYWIKFGLCEGSSDLIGITPIKITRDMVGKTVGVFTAIEVKKNVNKSYDKHRMITQQQFINFINKNGGFAFKSDNPEYAKKKLNELIEELY